MVRTISYDDTQDIALAYIKKTCPTFYAGPFLPGLYFEARILSPVSYSDLVTNQNTDKQFKQTEEELASAPPLCAITDYTMVKRFSHDTQNPVDTFIRLHYAPARAFGGVQVHILKRSTTNDGN